MTWVLRQPLCVGKCHDRVIRETIVFRQKREIRSFDVVEFVRRSYDITDDSSKHIPAYLNR